MSTTSPESPEISELNLSRLERLLELWSAMLDLEHGISGYNVVSGETVRFVGTEVMGERSYDVGTDELHDQRRTLAEAIARVLRDERRQRATKAIGLPIKDDELAEQFQQLMSAASANQAVLSAVDRDTPMRYDADQWRKFQQMLFQRGIVV